MPKGTESNMDKIISAEDMQQNLIINQVEANLKAYVKSLEILMKF